MSQLTVLSFTLGKDETHKLRSRICTWSNLRSYWPTWGGKPAGETQKYKKKGWIFQCQISGLVSCSLAACRHPGSWCSLPGSAEQALCLVQMLHLSASSGICSQETHIRGFILWIPFMSQAYKDSPPWGKPKGLAWNKNWPGSKDVTQAVRRRRGSSSGLCAVEIVEGEILQLKAILRSLRGKTMTC